MGNVVDSKVFNLDNYDLSDTLVIPTGVEVFNFKGDLIRKYNNVVFPTTIKEINGDFNYIVDNNKRFTTNLVFSKNTDVSVLNNILEPFYKKGCKSGGGVTVRELIESGQISAVGDISYALDIVIGGNGGDYKSELDKIKKMEDATALIKNVDGIGFSILTY